MKVSKIRYGETIPNPCVQHANFKPEFEIQLPDDATEEDVLTAVEYAKHLCHEAVTKALEIDERRSNKTRSLDDLSRQFNRLEIRFKDLIDVAQSVSKQFEEKTQAEVSISDDFQKTDEFEGYV